MKTTQLIAEHIVIGGLMLICLVIVAYLNDLIQVADIKAWNSNLKNISSLLLSIFFILSYSIGFFISIIAELVFKGVYKWAEKDYIKGIKENLDPEVSIDDMRHVVYADPNNRIDYHKSSLRLARGISFVILVLFILLTVSRSYLSVLALLFFVICLVAYYFRVMWFTKSIYHSYVARKSN